MANPIFVLGQHSALPKMDYWTGAVDFKKILSSLVATSTIRPVVGGEDVCTWDGTTDDWFSPVAMQRNIRFSFVSPSAAA